jgi:hypothetical protein
MQRAIESNEQTALGYIILVVPLKNNQLAR